MNGREDDAPSSLWELDFPVAKHAIGCRIWSTHDEPCSCGADNEVRIECLYVVPEVGSTAARLDRISPVELDCDGDTAGGDAA